MQIEDTHTWSKVHKKKVMYKISAKYVKYLGEKCGKLYISSILSSERGITPTKIDDTLTIWHLMQ